MINFDREPRHQTSQEVELNRCLVEYSEKFGKSYGFFIGFGQDSIDEVIKDIKSCIANNKPQVPPVYHEGVVY